MMAACLGTSCSVCTPSPETGVCICAIVKKIQRVGLTCTKQAVYRFITSLSLSRNSMCFEHSMTCQTKDLSLALYRLFVREPGIGLADL